MIDSKNKEILSLLLGNGGLSKAEVAREVGLAASAVNERVRRMESEGVIRGYEVRLDPQQLGKPLLAFVFVTEYKPSQGFDTGQALSLVTGMEELHKITGEDCYLLKIRAADTTELNHIIEQEVNTIQTVTGVRTTIVLRSIAEGAPMSGHELTDS